MAPYGAVQKWRECVAFKLPTELFSFADLAAIVRLQANRLAKPKRLSVRERNHMSMVLNGIADELESRCVTQATKSSENPALPADTAGQDVGNESKNIGSVSDAEPSSPPEVNL